VDLKERDSCLSATEIPIDVAATGITTTAHSTPGTTGNSDRLDNEGEKTGAIEELDLPSATKDVPQQGYLKAKLNGLMNWRNDQDGESDVKPEENGAKSVRTPVAKVQLPGVIVHLTFQHGLVEAFEIEDVETFPGLNEINLYFSALDDHRGDNYIDAFETVRWQRAAVQKPAEWESFASSESCFCCSSMFTWQSTSNSEAQQARDKHNCRCCGELVCNSCSKSRKTLPSTGFLRPVRVCDKCTMSGKLWI